jgi:hypothetical protein
MGIRLQDDQESNDFEQNMLILDISSRLHMNIKPV